MPVVKTKTLRSARAVAGIADYLLNAGHRNHREYNIHAPAAAETGAAMAARITHGLEVLNRERSAANKIRVHGWLAIIRFPDGTDLSAKERDHFEQAMLTGFDLPKQVPRAWHVNRLTKAADFNVVIGSIRDAAVPLLRRWVHSSLRARLIHVADAVTNTLNEIRASLGRALIATIASVQRRTATEHRGASLELLLAQSSIETRTPISRSSLPALLTHAGYQATDWDFDEDYLRIRLGRLLTRRTKFALDALVTETKRVAADLLETAREAGLRMNASLEPADKNKTSGMQAPAVSATAPTQLYLPL